MSADRLRELRWIRTISFAGAAILFIGLGLMFGFYAFVLAMFASGFLLVAVCVTSVLYEERRTRPRM